MKLRLAVFILLALIPQHSAFLLGPSASQLPPALLLSHSALSSSRHGSSAPHPLSPKAARPPSLSALKMQSQDSTQEEGIMFFSNRVRESVNPFLALRLLQNQAFLGFTALASIASLQADGRFGGVTVTWGILPLVLSVLGSVPLCYVGYKISRSEDKAWTDINCSTNLLALRLFGGKRAIPQAALFSAVIGIVTGICEELSFRGVGLPVLASRLEGSGLPPLPAALAIGALAFGAAHWSWGGKFKENLRTVGLQTGTGLWFGILHVISGFNLLIPAGAHALYDAFTLLEAHVATVSQLEYANFMANNPEGQGSEAVEAEIQRKLSAGEVTEELVNNARTIFYLADVSRDRGLGVFEVRNALFQLGSSVTEESLAEIFTASDLDQNGILDLAEFLVLIQILKESPLPAAPTKNSLLGLR